MVIIKKISDPLIYYSNKSVYSPSDDTFLIIDYFKKHINENYFDGKEIKDIQKLVDVGTGTGIIAIFLQLINENTPYFNPKIYASDILEEAIVCAKSNEKLNNIEEKITFIHSNFFENFPNSLKNSFDIIIFNPPYLPSSKKINKDKFQAIDTSWDGGKEGFELTIRFLRDAKLFLSEKPKSYIYFISSSSVELSKLEKKIIEMGFKHKILDKKHIFFEDIILYRIQSI